MNSESHSRAETGQPGRTEVMRSFLDAFNRHDVDAIMDFFTDDCEFDTPRGPAPYGRQLRGKTEVRGGIQARFDGIPDVHYGDELHWHCGDRGVSEWTISGTTDNGDRIEVRGCDLFQFSGNKIKRKDSFWKIVE
jgi:ketosteroid isomerase-like protein